MRCGGGGIKSSFVFPEQNTRPVGGKWCESDSGSQLNFPGFLTALIRLYFILFPRYSRFVPFHPNIKGSQVSLRRFNFVFLSFRQLRHRTNLPRRFESNQNNYSVAWTQSWRHKKFKDFGKGWRIQHTVFVERIYF